MLRVEMFAYNSTAQTQCASAFMDAASFLFLMLQSYMTVYIWLFLKLIKKRLLEHLLYLRNWWKEEEDTGF